MSPALALDVASKGDAFTGIKRAEEATFAITGVTDSSRESSRDHALENRRHAAPRSSCVLGSRGRIGAPAKPQIGLQHSPRSALRAGVGRRIIRSTTVTHRPIRACQRGAARIGPWITGNLAALMAAGVPLSRIEFFALSMGFRGLIEAPIRARTCRVGWKDVAVFHYLPRGY